MTCPLKAEREGFEPSIALRLFSFSRRARSTTPAPLQLKAIIRDIPLFENARFADDKRLLMPLTIRSQRSEKCF